MRPAICALILSVTASAATLDFEGLTDGTILSNEFSGLTLANARAVSAGLTLNELEFPTFSGVGAADDFGGPIEIAFASPVINFSGRFTYAAGLTLTAYDSLNQVVGSTNSAFGSNTVSSGNSPNELLLLSFSGGISRVTLEGGSRGGSFVVDDIEYSIPQAVPEPSTLLLAAPLFWLLLRRR